MKQILGILFFSFSLFGTTLSASEPGDEYSCSGYGPQSPRDIDIAYGKNKQIFSIAPATTAMNLCNIHMHHHAEHRAAAYDIEVKPEVGVGYQCASRPTDTASSSKKSAVSACGGLQSGDTIEVHWVFSSCAVSPGEGLAACVTDQCLNPNLRIESQVFTLSNDPQALDITQFTESKLPIQGYFQPKTLPSTTGKPVEYVGSTGMTPEGDKQACSPLQVTWSVRPECTALNINSLASWCDTNVYGESMPHKARKLIIDASLLSQIDIDSE